MADLTLHQRGMLELGKAFAAQGLASWRDTVNHRTDDLGGSVGMTGVFSTPLSPVPEPSAALLLAAAAVVLGLKLRRS
jgi:hypothetical protein